MTREVFAQKLIALTVVALAVIVLTPEQMLVAFIVFGQGHFLAAYYYQWRAKKITERGVSLYIGGALALFALAYATQRVDIIALVTMIVFLLHHFQDEVLLFGKERSLMRTVEQLGPVIMFTALTADALFLTTTALIASFVVIALVGVYCVFVALRKYRPDALSGYLALVTLALLFLALASIPVRMEVLAGALILNHYVCWYVHFYFRFRNDAVRLSRYIKDMVVINGLVILAYLCFVFVPQTRPLLAWFFLPIYFYIWTILHIVSSVRVSDYTDSIRLK